MITRIVLKNFKRFREQVFDIQDHVVLAGPNNAGKSTLLQALAVWNLARRKWLDTRAASKASKPKGVGITRRDFTAIPLREMNLLWTDTSTSLRKDEAEASGHKQGHPRPMVIEVHAQEDDGTSWVIGFEFVYQNTEMLAVRPVAEHRDSTHLAKDFDVIHVPAFSGIGAEETVHTREYQDHLVGQGKPGDIVRNLLKEVWQRDRSRWDRLVADIRQTFGYELLAPEFEGRPFIVCEYQRQSATNGKRGGMPRLDIATAGSGFHQVLMLLAFLYARDGAVLLLDEPDAHLHVVLQDEIYARLRSVAADRRSQLVVATHSEVIIDATSPANITSFYGAPHVLIADTEREQVREALKRLTSLDLLLADTARGFLYLEGETDFRLLRAWAGVLQHRAARWFSARQTGPAWQDMQGRNPREARAHFFALRAVRSEIQGFILLDSDNRSTPVRDLRADGLQIAIWPRYEAESYLLVPTALERYVLSTGASSAIQAAAGKHYLREQLPPAAFADPLADSDFMRSVPASKTLLPGFLRAAGVPLRKADYFRIAEVMSADEIHTDVTSLLDQLCGTVLQIDQGDHV